METNDAKLRRMLRWNCGFLAAESVLIIVGVILWMLGKVSGWIPLIILINMPVFIINIVNVNRIRQGRKPV